MAVDTAIIGGGPAGATCGLWLKLLGHAPIVIESRERLGGALCESGYANPWNTGMGLVSGRESAARIHDHLRAADVEFHCGRRVETVRKCEEGYQLSTTGGAGSGILNARHVVLATGISPVSGGFENRAGFEIGPGPAILEEDFGGQRVAILGGGDNGFEHYGLVRERGADLVRLFARTVRAQRQFVAAVPPEDLQTGPYTVDAAARTVDGVSFDRILVFYGYEARIDFLGDIEVMRDDRGFVATEAATAETGCAGLFAIGDMAGRGHPCCITAMADGVAAAKAIANRLDSGQ